MATCSGSAGDSSPRNRNPKTEDLWGRFQASSRYRRSDCFRVDGTSLRAGVASAKSSAFHGALFHRLAATWGCGVVRVYSAAKTVADCFKFRNKIGLDVVIEALKDCLRQKKATIDEIYSYAKVCRVSNVIRPYMDAL
jgi:hypothetical protein